jgi:hypothetical protein
MSGIPEADSPAFPTTVENCLITGEQGISMRDYFAARAMAALTPVYWEDFEGYESGAALNKCLCETAYEMADAMLLERAK